MTLVPIPQGTRPDLSDAAADPRDGTPKDAIEERLKRLGRRLEELQGALYAEGRRALLVVLQGRDTCGKDGTIRNVLGAMNPQGLHITSFRAPSTLELSHDYLWRVHQVVPARGWVGVFNRSHYEDVLVVRVRELVPPAVWEKRYAQINDFERMLAENDVTILKFFLHISREEQRQRLEARLARPDKNWKFNPDDLDARRDWDDYTSAYDDALARCSTAWAPWYVVPADRKPVRNLLVAETVVAALERLNPRYPPGDPDVLRLAGTID